MQCTEFKVENDSDNLTFAQKAWPALILQVWKTYIFSFTVSASFDNLCAQKEKQDPLRKKQNKTALFFLGYFLYTQLGLTGFIAAGGCFAVLLQLCQKRLFSQQSVWVCVSMCMCVCVWVEGGEHSPEVPASLPILKRGTTLSHKYTLQNISFWHQGELSGVRKRTSLNVGQFSRGRWLLPPTSGCHSTPGSWGAE